MKTLANCGHRYPPPPANGPGHVCISRRGPNYNIGKYKQNGGHICHSCQGPTTRGGHLPGGYSLRTVLSLETHTCHASMGCRGAGDGAKNQRSPLTFGPIASNGVQLRSVAPLALGRGGRRRRAGAALQLPLQFSGGVGERHGEPGAGGIPSPPYDNKPFRLRHM